MSLNNLTPLSNSKDWDKKWEGIFDHYQQDLRHAHYIRAVLETDEKKLLEIGAGSFRDMSELRRHGLECEGMDFSEEAIQRAKQRFPEFSNAIYHMSAFDLAFPDKSFDVSYHNGFWVLFDDKQIKKLITEQVRVTKDRIIATVHNAHNQQFMEYFDKLKSDDPLYDIRFFKVDEIIQLMSDFCSSVDIIPVGKGKRYHEDLLIENGIIEPEKIREVFHNSGLKFLNSSERLMCIGIIK